MTNGLLNKLDRSSGVYQILNTRNGKVYVGSAKNLLLRFRGHRSELRGRYHQNGHLQNAFNSEAAAVFVFLLLEHCSEDLLLEREQYWIDHYKAYDRDFGYNSARYAGRNDDPSPETRSKISAAIKEIWANGGGYRRHPHTEETKAILREYGKLQAHPSPSDATILARGASLRAHWAKNIHPWQNRKHSPESLEKMRAIKLGKPSPRKGKHLSPEHVANLRANFERRRIAKQNRLRNATQLDLFGNS